MLRCPYCDSPESTVLETRHHALGLYRRRRCGYCRESYTTVEAVQTLHRGRPKAPPATTVPAPTPKRRTGPLRSKQQ